MISEHHEIMNGDILVLLSCEKKLKDEYLGLNKNNFVVHESDLPRGKGWSPLTWQIIEGNRDVCICLFEAAGDIDSGDIYEKKVMKFSGHELIDELRDIQGQATIDIIMSVIERYPNIKGVKQSGEETFYKKRTPKDSELDISKTLKEQFNLLRVVDNDRYPAFFIRDGVKYILKIQKAK